MILLKEDCLCLSQYRQGIIIGLYVILNFKTINLALNLIIKKMVVIVRAYLKSIFHYPLRFLIRSKFLLIN